MKSLTIDERKKLGLGILEEISRVSEVLGTKFYLAFGTLLGAIRHKGYIPWDDDIDIWMFRDDYEKFLEHFNEIASPRYTVYSTKNIENYPYLMPKVMDNATHVREKFFAECPYLGIWVDIFPIDYLSQEGIDAARALTKLEQRRWCALYHQSTWIGKLKLIGYNMIQRDTRMSDLNMNPADLVNEIHRIHRCTEVHDQVRSPSSADSFYIFYNTHCFDKTIMVPFETLSMPIPSGYDELLRTVYGDYMTPPPVSKQKLARHLIYSKMKDYSK